MYRYIRRLLCYLGIHRPPPGVVPRYSIRWVCSCGAILPGRYGVRR